jgi:uncharacterized membrane protein YccC
MEASPGFHMLFVPRVDEVVFSIKTFASAMLALYISLALDLSRPAWAMGTVFIVAQPLSGALASKALFRILGTIAGGIFAIIAVPNLVNAPELMSLVLSLWVGTCLYFSLLDRTPRSYVFMLAGYTAAIIGFPSVADPHLVFDTALARVEEITVGILCATVIGRVVLPRHVGTVLLQRLSDWFAGADAWAKDAFAGRAKSGADQGRLAAEVAEMRGLAIHLDFEPNLVGTTRQMHALHGRMLMLMPILSAISDRVEVLAKEDNGLSFGLRNLMDDIAEWAEAGPSRGHHHATALLRRIDAELAMAHDLGGRIGVLRISLLSRLQDLVQIRRELRVLWLHMNAGKSGLPAVLRNGAGSARDYTPHVDRSIALLSAIGASAATALACLFWISTGWPEGAVAAQMAAVACSILAAQDDPGRAIVGFLRNTIWASLVVGIYLFLVLPHVTGFLPLMIVLAPYFIWVGTLMARPATFGLGMALSVNTAVLLGIQAQFSVDFSTYLNSTLATVGGMSLAVGVTRIIRFTGVEWRVRHLLEANWREIAEAAESGSRLDTRSFAQLMLDRLGLIVPRLSVLSADSTVTAQAVIADVRVGLNIIELNGERHASGQMRTHVLAVLEAISRFYRARIAGEEPGTGSLVKAVDVALDAVADPQIGRADRIVQGLVGIRRALAPDAPPYIRRAQDAVAHG